MIGRGEALDRIDRCIRVGRGALVAGPRGVGVSAVLRAVAAAGRPRAVVLHEVGSWPRQALPPGTLVVLDDAHQLDGEAGAAARDAVLNGGCQLVIGSTSPDRCPGSLTWLWASGTVDRVELSPLDADQVSELVAGRVGAPPDGATVAALLADSAGLPALLVPAVDAATSAGALVERSGCARLSTRLPLSPGLRTAVHGMTGHLPDAAGALLALVCTAGELPVLTAEVDPAALSVLVDGALVELRGDGGAVAAPVAGAVARVVLEDLGPLGRQAVARSLLASTAGDAVQRVRWQLLAGEPAAPEDLLTAARADQAAGALVEAERLAARVDGGAAALVRAEVLAALGRRRDAADLLEGVLAAGDLDDVTRALCTFEFATLLLWNLGEGERALTLMDQAAAALGGPAGAGSVPSPLAGRVAAAVGALRAYAGRPAAALEALAAHAADPLAHDDHLADHVLAVARSVTGACELAVVDARRGLERCTSVTGPVPGPDPEIHVLSTTLALGEAGLLDEAATLAEEWYGRAARRGLHVGWLALARARVALAAGDLGVATRYGREALADFADLDNHAPRRWALAALVLAASAAGDGPGAAALLAQLDDLGPTAVRFLEPDVERARAWGAAATGKVSQAREDLLRAASEAEGAGLTTLALVAHHDALRLGSRLGAAAVVRLGPSVDGPLAAARRRHAEAFLAGDAAGLLAAADELAVLGADLLAADAAAQAIVRLRRGGSAARLREAVARCQAHRARCGPAATPALREVGVARLSGREQEVARLAAAGASSKAIALQLGISVRTVDNLLQRAYTKLGVHGRAGLGAALDRAAM